LKEYTFLKRPVLIFNDQIFIGNAPKVVAAAKAFLQKK
jgi:arsenate reductase